MKNMFHICLLIQQFLFRKNKNWYATDKTTNSIHRKYFQPEMIWLKLDFLVFFCLFFIGNT